MRYVFELALWPRPNLCRLVSVSVMMCVCVVLLPPGCVDYHNGEGFTFQRAQVMISPRNLAVT